MTEGHDRGIGPSLQEKRELALEAKDLIESKAFEHAKADLREALVNELVTSQSRERRDDIIAELKVLESVFGRLKAQINDYNAGVRKSQSQASPGIAPYVPRRA